MTPRQGLKDVEEFKEKTKAQQLEQIARAVPQEQRPSGSAVKPAVAPVARKDASPVKASLDILRMRRFTDSTKPLAEFMDVDRVLSIGHSASEVAALWTAYHNAKSSGTGRGYLSAVIPVSTYEQMLERGLRYPTFVVPLRRPPPDGSPEGETAYEFYFLEWSGYDAPARRDLGPEANPRLSTVILTSLAEYKLRQSYATPHLALTHYTDLARSHGVVLMRGELTAAGADRYWLSQADAQMLCLGLQRFYLPSAAPRDDVLRAFHEQPDRFDWQTVIRHAAL